MAKGKRWMAAGAAVVLLGAGLLVSLRYGRERKARQAAAASEAAERRWRGFAAGVPGMPGAAGEGQPGAPGAAGGKSPAALQAELDTAMTAWRNAIINKDSDTVITLDRAFTEAPARYGPALIKSAQSDENERVRAFSTRVLGKLKMVELAEVFGQLLEDKSPYVRQNAAWALGELGTRPDGRQAAQRAASDLRRLEQHDAFKDVRTAANSALKRLQ